MYDKTRQGRIIQNNTIEYETTSNNIRQYTARQYITTCGKTRQYIMWQDKSRQGNAMQ